MKQQRQDFCVCCGAPIQTYGLGMVCYECEHNPTRPIVKTTVRSHASNYSGKDELVRRLRITKRLRCL